MIRLTITPSAKVSIALAGGEAITNAALLGNP